MIFLRSDLSSSSTTTEKIGGPTIMIHLLRLSQNRISVHFWRKKWRFWYRSLPILSVDPSRSVCSRHYCAHGTLEPTLNQHSDLWPKPSFFIPEIDWNSILVQPQQMKHINRGFNLLRDVWWWWQVTSKKFHFWLSFDQKWNPRVTFTFLG